MELKESSLSTCNAALKVTFFPKYFLCRTLAILAVKVEELSTRNFNPNPGNMMKIIRRKNIEQIETKED